jgi:uncharacterized protein (TIGR03067 family)
MNSLAGTWQPFQAELDGEQAPAEVLANTSLTLGAREYEVRFSGQISDRGTYRVDAAGLHLKGLDGPNAGRIIPCLYKHRGNRLRICFGLDGRQPAGFATKPGTNRYLVDYKRVVLGAASPA